MSRANLSKVAFLMFGLVFMKFRKLKKLPTRKQLIPNTTELKMFSYFFFWIFDWRYQNGIQKRFIVVFIPIIFAWGVSLFLKNINISQITKEFWLIDQIKIKSKEFYCPEDRFH